jgi:hypothetical protein
MQACALQGHRIAPSIPWTRAHVLPGAYLTPVCPELALTLPLSCSQAEEAARSALAAGDAAPCTALLLPALSLPAFASSVAPRPPADQYVFAPQLGGPPAGAPALVSAAEFAHNWRVFTLDQLEGLDWRNLLAAGGSVLACASTTRAAAPPAAAAKKATKQLLCRAQMHGVDAALTASPAFLAYHGRDAPGSLATADIDLWLVGSLTREAAAAKLAHVEEVLRANAAKRGATVGVAHTPHTLTFFSAFPFRCVQVVHALFPSAAAPLLDFDLDCCAMGWDGAQVVALPRALAAATQRTNVLRSDIEPRGRSVGRAYKYSQRGFGLVLPRELPEPLNAARADDAFSAAKLAALLRVGAPLSVASLFRWRAPGDADAFPRQPCEEPPQLWVAGFCAGGHLRGRQPDARCVINVAGILDEERAYEQEGGGAPLNAEEADILAQCKLVAQLYPSPRGARFPVPDFPHELERATDYGNLEPDIAYGPPLASDSGKGAPPPLDLSPAYEHSPWEDRQQPPRRAPVSTEETAAMIAARAPHGVRVGALASLLPDCAFSAASFGDARPVAPRARVAVESVTLPPLPLAGAKAAPLTRSASAFGCSWQLSATTQGGWLVIRLTLASPPPAGLLTLPSPAGAAAAPSRLLPVNIVLQAGSGPRAVYLDSHAVFGVDAGAAPRSWQHVVFWDNLPKGAPPPLQVTLQAVRLGA